MGKVGGPEDASAGPLVELNGDGELALRNIGMGGSFVEFGRSATVATDRQVAELDVEAIGIDFRAGVAYSGGQAAPVGISAGPGCLHQGRVGNGLGNLEGVGVGGRAVDLQFDNVSDAFAVGDDLACERGADLGEGGGELGVAGTNGCATGSRGEQQDGVVGGGVASTEMRLKLTSIASRR